MQNRKRDTDVENRLLVSVGEGKGGMFRENSIETCILSRVKQITSPGWMHETSAQAWCTGKTQRDWVEREVGAGIRMGNTCISKADSCQCMKIKRKKNAWPKETRRKCTIKVIQTTTKKKKKNLPVLQETQVWSLDQEDPLEKEMATHFSILAWRIPWTEEPIRLPSMGLKESDMTERLSTVLPSFRIWQKTIGIKGLWIVWCSSVVKLLLSNTTEKLDHCQMVCEKNVPCVVFIA